VSERSLFVFCEGGVTLSPRVSEAHKEQRRQSILDAAMGLFISRGYQLTTIDQIAAVAGLSVGALYRYFRTKDEILLALLDERLGRAPELFGRLLTEGGDPWQRLRRSIDLFVTALGVRHPGTGRLLLVALAESIHNEAVHEALHRRFGDLARYLEEILREGQETGLFRAELDATALATMLITLADGIAIYWVTKTPGVDLRRLKQLQIDWLKTYLTPQEEK
jgi:AcrR family transcriptional regulator